MYSRNRNFRIYKSCKIGKTATLEISDRVSDRHYVTEKDLFLDTLICNIPVSSNLRVLQCDEEPLQFPPRKVVSNLNTAFKKEQKLVSSAKGEVTNEGHGPSPFPYLDQFIHQHINSILPGNIRSWIYFPTSQLMVYNIIGNR